LNRIRIGIVFLHLLVSITSMYAIPNLDSLEKALQTETGESKLYALAELAWYYHNIKPSKAIVFAKQGLALAKEQELIRYQTEFNATLGANYYTVGDLDKAIDYYHKAIATAAQFNDSISIASYFNNIGMAYKNKGLFDSSLTYYRKGSKIYSESNLPEKVATTYANIASIYEALNKDDNAFKYYGKALEVIKTGKDSNEIAMLYNNLALIYQRNGKLNKAEIYLIKSLEMSRAIGDSNGVVVAYANIGLNYDKQKKYNKALETFHNTLPLCKEIEDEQILTNLYNYIGSSNYHLKKYDEAIYFINKSLAISRKNKIPEIMEESYNLLRIIYLEKGEYKSAYDYLQKYTAVHDSLYNTNFNEKLAMETARQTSKIQVELDVEKMNNEILLLSQKEQKQKSYVVFLSIIAGILLVSILAILILHRSIRRRKKNLEEAYLILSKKDEELRQTIAIKDRFFRIIAHDLKTPLSIFINVSDYLINNYDEMKEEDIRNFLADMQKVSINLNALLDDLLLWAKLQSGMIKPQFETIDLSLLANRTLSDFKQMADNKEQSLTGDIQTEIFVKADTNLVFTVMKNLVQNAIKFTPNHGRIFVKSYHQGENAIFEVVDNGIGISDERKKKLFTYEKVKTYGTNNETGTGIGLLLSKEIAELNNGHIEFETSENAGSSFRFILPLNSREKNEN